MEMSPLVHDFTLAIAELPPMQTVPCRALLLFLSGLHSPIRTFSGQLALECIQYLRDMIVELGSRNSGHGRKGRVAFRGAAPRLQDGATARTQVPSQSSQLLFCLLHSLPWRADQLTLTVTSNKPRTRYGTCQAGRPMSDTPPWSLGPRERECGTDIPWEV